jgi:hypothetical protein
MMSSIREVLTTLRESNRVRIHPPAGQPKWPTGVVPPQEVAEFYALCGGIEFLDDEDQKYARYRILAPSKVTDIGTATCLEAATEPPLSEWFAIGEDDNSESAAIDVAPQRSGQCYDVFHETWADPASASIVATSFAEFLERLFRRGKAYWFDDDFVAEYFSDDTSEEE